MIRWKVYCLTFSNGKKYIGVTKKKVIIRFEEHLKSAFRGGPLTIHSAIRKYGAGNISVKRLSAYSSEQEAKDAEQYFIKRENTLRPNGYNSTIGGNGVIDPSGLSEEIRITKMKKTMSSFEYKNKQHHIQKGLWTDKRREQRSEFVKALWQDEQYRKQQIEAHIVPEAKCHHRQLLSSEDKKQIHKSVWNRPGYHDKMREIHRNSMTPERRQYLSTKTKQHFSNPDIRKAHQEKMLQVMNNPEIKEKCRQAHL